MTELPGSQAPPPLHATTGAAPAALPARGVFGGAAWRIGRVAGIEVTIDHTWLLIFVLVTLSLGAQLTLSEDLAGVVSPVGAWIAAAATSLLFFVSIFLHELGHSLVAKRLAVDVRSITLFVFGGVAQFASEPKRPRHEVTIAVAGPLVSLALAGLFHAAGAALGGVKGGWPLMAAALGWLARINLVVAVFNIVPGFPLDGGRVLRGIVWALTHNFERATAIAASTGSFFAYGLIALGVFVALFGGQLLGGLWLAFIGWFLLTAARGTLTQMLFEQALGGVRIGEAVIGVDDSLVSGDESVETIVMGPVLRQGRRTFYVVDTRGRLRGLVTLAELAAVPPEQRATRRLEEIMVAATELVIADPEEDGWTVLKRMVEQNVNQIPVLRQGQLVGAVTRERLMALVQARVALARGESSRRRV